MKFKGWIKLCFWLTIAGAIYPITENVSRAINEPVCTPSITLQPTNWIACIGQTAKFTATASGNPTPTPRWQASTNGVVFTNIVAATNATLSFITTALDDGHRYRVIFTNSCGSVTSSVATLTGPSLDSVGDGILDCWRQQYFGGSGAATNDTSCASCDPDGDGYTNLQEFHGATDPMDPNSPGHPNLFFYDNLGRLAVVTATNGTDAAFYDYDAVGNITAIRRETIGPIKLFVFSPETAGGNTTITLQGTGFSSILSCNTVLFGSITAQVVSATANQLKVLVPTNAVSGLISVHAPFGVSTNARTFNAGISVSVSPSTVTLSGTFQQQFTATVYGSVNQSVTWNLNGWIPAGSNSSFGLITTSGLYTAPTNSPLAGAITVHARSVADPDPLKDGIATITVANPLGPVYSPAVSAQPGVPTVAGPIYSLTVSAQPGVPDVIGPVFSPAVSAQPGLPDVVGPIYSPTVSAGPSE